jgi:hypothetical protein
MNPNLITIGHPVFCFLLLIELATCWPLCELQLPHEHTSVELSNYMVNKCVFFQRLANFLISFSL